MITFRSPDTARLIKFGAVGGFCSIITLATRALASLALSYEFAVAISQVVGMTCAFVLNRMFVFRGFKGGLVGAYFRFFGVNVMSLIIATTVSSLMYRLVFKPYDVWHSEVLAQVVGLAATAIPSYFGHARFSFRSSS